MRHRETRVPVRSTKDFSLRKFRVPAVTWADTLPGTYREYSLHPVNPLHTYSVLFTPTVGETSLHPPTTSTAFGLAHPFTRLRELVLIVIQAGSTLRVPCAVSLMEGKAAKGLPTV